MECDLRLAFRAIDAGNLQEVQEIFSSESHCLNDVDVELGVTPLFYAAAKNKSEIVTYLLDHKDIDLAWKNRKGQNILDFANQSLTCSGELCAKIFRKCYRL